MATEERSQARLHTPLLLTLLFVALVVAVLVAAAIRVRWSVAAAVGDEARVRAARVLAEEMLEQQLDEETGLRGYLVSHQTILLQPYYAGRAALPDSFMRVDRSLETLGMSDASQVLHDARDTNARWLHQYAAPILAGRRVSSKRELQGKTLVDRYRIDMALVGQLLARRGELANDRAQNAVILIGLFGVVAVAAVVLAAILFTAQQYRLTMRLEQQLAQTEENRRRSAEMRAAYEAEKRIADTLQEAFTQYTLPHSQRVIFSAAYLPAAEQAKIGGDWYDALELSRDRVLVAIGDVAGHGIEAAVAMNKARHLLTACALIDPTPGPVLERVNTELFRNAVPMITAVAGLVDAQNCRFEYAVAGHPPPILWEPGQKARLLDGGSLPLGVAREADYPTRTVQSAPGALLVLYTDGAIEHSRDVITGEALLLSTVESAVERSKEGAAGAILRGIFAGRDVADDVAILTVSFATEGA